MSFSSLWRFAALCWFLQVSAIMAGISGGLICTCGCSLIRSCGSLLVIILVFVVVVGLN
jgi:hypothetical protein